MQKAGVSLADLIALGAITAVGVRTSSRTSMSYSLTSALCSLKSCGGPVIPFKVGRIDAKAPVAEGFLPLPEQSTETHTQQFARMGFTPYVRQTFLALSPCSNSR